MIQYQPLLKENALTRINKKGCENIRVHV